MRKSKIALLILLLCLLAVIFCVPCAAGEVYSFDPSELSELPDDDEYERFLEKLPDSARSRLTEKDISGYDAGYFIDLAADAFGEAVLPALKTFSMLMGIVILSGAFNMFSKTVKTETEPAFSVCGSLCAALAVWEIQKSVFETVRGLLETMSDTMLAVVPAMEAMYIASGNITSAAVSSSGVNMMISFCETLFSKVLYPGAFVCWLLAVCSAVTKNGGISFMSKTLRTVVTGVLLAVMALMSFVLVLQVETAQTADSFAQRTIRYAVGSYVPIVGGSVSESFSVISQSLKVIRQTCGVTGIIVIIIMFIFPFAAAITNRISLSLASAAAGMLGSDRERDLLSEAGSVCTLMIGICAAGAAMYIVALGIFCRTPAAMG